MTTKLREIFEKPVDRAIEGIIKADDDASYVTLQDKVGRIRIDGGTL